MTITWHAGHNHPEQRLECEWPLKFWNGTGTDRMMVDHKFAITSSVQSSLDQDLARVQSEHDLHPGHVDPRYDPTHPDYLCYGYTHASAARELQSMRELARENERQGLNPMMGINMAYEPEERYLHETL